MDKVHELPENRNKSGIFRDRSDAGKQLARMLRPAYADERPTEAETRVLPPYRGLLPADYYLWGRTHFADLPAARFRPLGAEA